MKKAVAPLMLVMVIATPINSLDKLALENRVVSGKE